MLTRRQINRINKIAHNEFVTPIIMVSDADGTATITYWNTQRLFREIVITDTGKLLSDSEGVA